MKTIAATKSLAAGASASPFARKPTSAWATRSEMWRSRVERVSARRTKRAKPQSALILAGHGVSLRIHGGALEIQNGLTHYPQKRETYLFFRGDADLPERIILLDGSGSVSFDVLSWDGAHLHATPNSEAGDTEGWRQSPRPFDSGDPRQSGARRAQAHTRPVFEADFQPGSFGYRPKRTAHDAIKRVAEAIVQRKTRVLDFDLRFSFVKDWVEKKVRRHLAHARKRNGFGWERWSRPWLYDTLKLFSGYRVRRDMPKVAPA